MILLINEYYVIFSLLINFFYFAVAVIWLSPTLLILFSLFPMNVKSLLAIACISLYYLWKSCAIIIMHIVWIVSFHGQIYWEWDTKILFQGPHTRSKNSQYFEAKNGRPIFDKILDAIWSKFWREPTHVSKYWRVVKILTTRQNIDDSSKYIKQIWSVNILSQCIFWWKKSPTHGQKSSQNFDVNFLLQYIDGFFDGVWAP